jgi:hypothetical protein
MHRFYDAVGGQRTTLVAYKEIGEELGWTSDVLEETVEYLQSEELIKIFSFKWAGLTHDGMKTIENALSSPARPSFFFPATNTIVAINNTFVFNGTVIGRDQTVSNIAGGDVIGRDKTAPNDLSDSRRDDSVSPTK